MREKITYEHITWWVGIFLGESFAIIQRQAHKGRGIELQFFTLLLSVFFFKLQMYLSKKEPVFFPTQGPALRIRKTPSIQWLSFEDCLKTPRGGYTLEGPTTGES